jgi:hypothetical protein
MHPYTHTFTHMHMYTHTHTIQVGMWGIPGAGGVCVAQPPRTITLTRREPPANPSFFDQFTALFRPPNHDHNIGATGRNRDGNSGQICGVGIGFAQVVS